MTAPAAKAKIITNKAVIDHYTDLAPVYDRQWGGVNRAVRQWVMDRLPGGLPVDARIFDAGCGTGHALSAVAAARPNYKLHGVDLCPAMLAIAMKNNGGATLATGDLAHINPGAGQYNVVLSLNVLRHMNDAAAHLRRLHDALVPGGTLFLCDMALEGFSMRLAEKHWRRFDPAHARGFTRAEMTGLLAPLHLSVVDSALLRPDIFWRLQIYQLTRKE